MRVLKLLGAALLLCLLAMAGVIYDVGWNEGRLVSKLLGRDHLVAQCVPAVRTTLAARGFAPVDIEMGSGLSVSFASGWPAPTRILAGPFTFSDGPDGQRVDGTLVCRAQGATVRVDVDVDALPLRAA